MIWSIRRRSVSSQPCPPAVSTASLNAIFSLIADISAHSPYIAQEINLLKKAFNDERTERMKMQAAEMAKVLNGLKPIRVPKTKDNRILELQTDLIKVKHVSANRV